MQFVVRVLHYFFFRKWIEVVLEVVVLIEVEDSTEAEVFLLHQPIIEVENHLIIYTVSFKFVILWLLLYFCYTMSNIHFVTRLRMKECLCQWCCFFPFVLMDFHYSAWPSEVCKTCKFVEENLRWVKKFAGPKSGTVDLCFRT